MSTAGISGTVHFGVGAMICYSFLLTSQLVFNKIMEDAGWPVWDALLWTNVGCFAMFFIILVIRQPSMPSFSQAKWAALRSVLQILSFVCSTVSVTLLGAPGDVNALTSVNVVAASAIGHLFLNERLRWMHTFAVFSSLVGAICISKPEFVFNTSAQGSGDVSRYLGYFFALMSGFLRAVALVCARKIGQIPVSFTAVLLCGVGSLIFFALPYTPLANTAPMALIGMEPLGALLHVGVNVLIALFSIVTGSLGAMLCPAAVSATVFTGTGMVMGYLAQAFLFSSMPDPLTLVGAVLMLGSVAIMAAFRVRPRAQGISTAKALPVIPPVDAHVPGFCLGEDVSVSQADSNSIVSTLDDDDDDSESMLSFAAIEFVKFEAHSETVRLRKSSAGSRIVEQVLQSRSSNKAIANPPSVATTIGAAMTLSTATV